MSKLLILGEKRLCDITASHSYAVEYSRVNHLELEDAGEEQNTTADILMKLYRYFQNEISHLWLFVGVTELIKGEEPMRIYQRALQIMKHFDKAEKCFYTIPYLKKQPFAEGAALENDTLKVINERIAEFNGLIQVGAKNKLYQIFLLDQLMEKESSFYHPDKYQLTEKANDAILLALTEQSVRKDRM